MPYSYTPIGCQSVINQPLSPLTAMPSLNLPDCNLHIIVRNGRRYVFDVVRRRYVAFTPEEEIRQRFVRFLNSQRGYPLALMANEVSLKVGNTQKRCDTVVYGRDLTPLMIVEYKAPSVELTQAVFRQIGRYNIALRVGYLTVSNGLRHVCCRLNYESGTSEFCDIPTYDELTARRPTV